MDPKVKAAIAAIPGTAWTPIRYPRAIWDDQLRRWVSDVQVAEVDYTAFASKKGKAITARLIVRLVKDLNRSAAAGQGACAWMAVCKTIGLAYVGSNPTLATIKLAGQTRSSGSGLMRCGSGLG